MEILKDSDVSLGPLTGNTVAVLGYGNQGRAQALNLRDSGVKVIVGNREDEYRKQAADDGFTPVDLIDAATAADILLVLTTDECMPEIWENQISPGIEMGNTLCWGSGYNVGYGIIKPPSHANWIMIAPIMPGNVVRTRYEEGSGSAHLELRHSMRYVWRPRAVHCTGRPHAQEPTRAGDGKTRG